MISIAAILTCHNRKDKTLSCLQHLFEAQSYYNCHNNKQVIIKVFLTDDGCTDGTASDVKTSFKEKNIEIIQGDGNLYWAGGMRMAWKKALVEHERWNYYLLLNDDTDPLTGMFIELFETEAYCLDTYGCSGIYSGITCSKINSEITTYSGNVWKNKMLAISHRLGPCNHPQMCDMTNANILLIPKIIVDKMGIFWDGYQHSSADYDYTNHARQKGIPVLITACACGKCDNDHISYKNIQDKLLRMNFKERREYFSNPLHSTKNYLKYIRRNAPIRLPLVWIGRMCNLYFPKLYYIINKSRV